MIRHGVTFSIQTGDAMQMLQRWVLATIGFFVALSISSSALAQGYGFGPNVQSNGFYGGLSNLQNAPLHGGRPGVNVPRNNPVQGKTYTVPSYQYSYQYQYQYGPNYGAFRPNYGYGAPGYGYGYGYPSYGFPGYGYGVQSYGTQLNIYPNGIIQGYTGQFGF